MNTHGERLASLRQAAGFRTRTDFHRKLTKAGDQITLTRLGRLERGEVTASVREIEIICRHLNTTADYWLRGGCTCSLAHTLGYLDIKKRDLLVKIAADLQAF